MGVSPDGPEDHRAFAAKFNLPFTLLCDPGHEVMKQYGAFGKKIRDGKETMGVIRSTAWIGSDGKVRRHWPKVTDAAAHPAEVLEAIQGRGA